MADARELLEQHAETVSDHVWREVDRWVTHEQADPKAYAALRAVLDLIDLPTCHPSRSVS